MNRKLDRTSDVYWGLAGGPAFQQHHRERIHWMCSEVRGRRVLDIGCSQGISSILLAREGFEVVGVDLEPDLIEQATEALSKESESVRQRVRFFAGDVIQDDFDLGHFDSVIAGEILEHLLQPQRLVKRAHELLSPGGRCIATVPFGVHPFPEHTQTFYVRAFAEVLAPYFAIRKLNLIHVAAGAQAPVPIVGAVAERLDPPAEVDWSRCDEWLAFSERGFKATETRYLAQLAAAQGQIESAKSFAEKATTELRSERDRAAEHKRTAEERDAAITELRNTLDDLREQRAQRLRRLHETKAVLLPSVRSVGESEGPQSDQPVGPFHASDEVGAGVVGLDAVAREAANKIKELSALVARLQKSHRALGQACKERDRVIRQFRWRLGMMEDATSYRLGLMVVRALQRPYQLLSLPFRATWLLVSAGVQKRKSRGQRREPRLADLPVELPPVPDVATAAGAGSRIEGYGQSTPEAPSNHLATGSESESTKLLLSGLYEDPRFVRDLRVAAILDEFSKECFSPECRVITFRPDNWEAVLQRERPHFLLVESAWKGNGGSWEYRVGSYAYPGREEVERLVDWCRRNGVPTVFWSKEDPVHFDKFLESARLFDVVFTTDADCIPRYRKAVGHERVYSLPFAAQPQLHNPIRVPGHRERNVCFAGSYYRNRHPKRREEMDWLLEAAMPFGLEIYDRAYGQQGSDTGSFGFPERFASAVVGGVAYRDVVKVYKQYRVFLNVNSVADSPTMFSRRVFELLACGTPVVSTPARGIEELLGREAVQVVSSPEEAGAALRRLLEDGTWRERIGLSGQRLIAAEHTYAHRLAEISGRLGLPVSPVTPLRVSALTWAMDAAAADRVIDRISKQEVETDLVIACQAGERGHVEEALKRAGMGERSVVLSGDPPGEGQRWWARAIEEASGDYIALFCPEDHYGSWYLADLVRAIEYSGADVAGKAAYLGASGSGERAETMEARLEYSFVPSVLPATMVGRRDLLADVGWPGAGLHDVSLLAPWSSSGVHVFSADRFNYLREGADGVQGVDL